ncbi:MAG TPA: TonB-dependent receptor [Saprospirales bacterium]|nr:TonB-dependent receptor [Saprospirales bacterium]
MTTYFYKTFLISAALLLSTCCVKAQQTPDSLQPVLLKEMSVRAARTTIDKLPPISNTFIWAGKKSEVIQVENTDANIAEKTPRQIFAKIPGVFVYDMDGAGNQINISTRGLDPHRGWEFNIRANGIMTNSDIYGYPASHFSLPMEAIGRVELVRGTGALQYGAQFGGMLNYVLKNPDTTRSIGLESVNSVGSYGLLSSYNAIGGKIGKLQYYAFYSKRVSDGYRKNGESSYDGQGLSLQYMPTKHLALKAELMRSYYLYHIPGPLTDAQFEADPRQSTRSRNYYSPEIYVPSLSAVWQVAPGTRLSWTASAVLGERRSVQFDRTANIVDAINPQTLNYAGRQVDIDGFNSYNTELRLLQDYSLLGKSATLAAGVQYFNNDLNRRQQGKGSTGTDYDLGIDATGWGRDLHLRSKNVAFSLENKWQLSRRLMLSPGVRVELGESKLSGTTAYYDDDKELPNTVVHRFPLLGINGEYVISPRQTIYGGISQAYRPVIFKDIIPGNVYEKVNKNLKYAYGYNAELGWRGNAGGWKWDAGTFMMQYNNRLGNLAQYDADIDTFILFRTNIGDSRTYGLEMFVEYGTMLGNHWYASVFTSTSYFNARYLGDSIRVNGRENRSIKGKKVESVPDWISRNGVNVRYKGLSMSLLYSYTAKSFADPLNTVEPTATGAVGLVPSYGLLDLNTTYRIRNLSIRFNVNNIANKQYFTKRPTLYPGAGIWPSDGRSITLTVGIKI